MRQRHRSENKTTIHFATVMSFVIPLTYTIEIPIIGRLFMPEVLLAGLLPALLYKKAYKLKANFVWMFLLLSCLWLSGQIITDLLRSTEFANYARGWATIVFTTTNFVALYLLLDGRLRRIVLFAFGLAIGIIVKYFVSPSEYAIVHPWKFGYGVGVTWLLILAAMSISGRNRKGWVGAAIVMICGAALNIVMGFRSLGGILLLVSLYMMVQNILKTGPPKENRIRLKHAIALVVTLICGGWGTLIIYSSAASSGVLGERAQTLYEQQSAGKFGVIIGGRSEALASIPAIINSPLLGYGSWAEDCGYAELLLIQRRNLGYTYGISQQDECRIPAHSHLLGSWVEAGILGVPIWLWLTGITIKVLIWMFRVVDIKSPLVVFAGLVLLWDIWFSPYGGAQRFITPFLLLIVIKGSEKIPTRKVILRSDILRIGNARSQFVERQNTKQ